MKNIVISSILAAILCGTINASEADFADKKNEFDFSSFDYLYTGIQEVQSLLAFFEDSGLKEINVGNTPNQKKFYSRWYNKG